MKESERQWKSSFGSKDNNSSRRKKKGSAGTKLAALKARKMIAAAREKSAGAELSL